MALDSLSRVGVLVAQLESTVASAPLQSRTPVICFDLLSDLLSILQEEPKERLLSWQRKCEDALQALVLLGVRPPVRRLAAKALVLTIEKGDAISIYSRASGLQGWFSETKKADASCYIGAANSLGALYRRFGHKITSGLVETGSIVTRLMKFSEVGVRQAALQLLKDALEGSGGGGTPMAYTEALRIVLRAGGSDKSPVVRASAADCLRAFALTGGPGFGIGGLESCATLCVKALEDNSQLVRDAFASALGALLALGLNPEAQAQSRGKSQTTPTKTMEGGLQKHLVGPFMRAAGSLSRYLRVGLTMAWVAFLQGMHLTYHHSDIELQPFGLQALNMLSQSPTSSIDSHAQACVQYILRVGIVEQMGEPAQKEFLDLLTKQLSLAGSSPPMLIVILRTLSHLLVTLGEVPPSTRGALEDSLLGTLSNSSMAVRVEAALTVRALAEVDSACANSLMSCGIATLRALREIVTMEKGDRLRLELDSLHGQAAMLAALLAVSPKLLLGVPSRLPSAILDVAKSMVSDKGRGSGAEKEAGWLLIAAIVSSLAKEELEEQEFEIIALWTVPFGGNSEERLKKAESNLSVEICVWSAAVEALTAFVKSYVVPNLTPEKEGILLQPVLGYLSGALAYLSSPTLQHPSADLKHLVDLFMIQTLATFEAIPDPYAYKSDHATLLTLCSIPFKDPSSVVASSSLRQVLDARDASLGPWMPGRDSFEDELRAFEGGSNGPVACVWENEFAIFSQPLSVSTSCVNHMILCFGQLFAVQMESKKMQLLDMIEGSMRSAKRHSWQASNATNVCLALLVTLKCYMQLQGNLGACSMDGESEVLKRMQLLFQSFLADELSSAAQRRAAAEGLGILARIGNDAYAARLMRSLLSDASSTSDANQKGAIALVLGCIHRSVGGMALSALVPATVNILCTMAKEANALVHIWSLHGLWLTAEAAGLSYIPYVQVTMSLAMDILLSEEHVGPGLSQSIGRLVNALVAVTGPELSPQSSFFNRCKSIVSDIRLGDEPAALLESVLFTQQLVLFAPQALSVHAHVQTLKPALASRQPSIRKGAVSTLRHLAERDPILMVEERVEENLFSMLDSETDARIVYLVRLTLSRLLEAACPLHPSRWLRLCRNVVLATSSTISAGGGSTLSGLELSSSNNNPEHFGNDDEGMITKSSASIVHNGNLSDAKLKEGEQLPRYRTRLFAAECLSHLPVAVGTDVRHFCMKESAICEGDWLILRLSELVAVAYQVATGVFESMRPLGVMLVDTIIEKFGDASDPDFEGHLLLEQYQAQIVSAIRTALDPSAGPLLLDVGLGLAARMITSGIANGDAAVMRRVFSLVSRQLNYLADLQYRSFAEWVGCKVQVTLFAAFASIKNYACLCLLKGSSKQGEGNLLAQLLEVHSMELNRCWLGILRDYMLLKAHSSTKSESKGVSFLSGVMLPAVATTIQPYLSTVSPAVLEAVTVDAVPSRSDKSNSNSEWSKNMGIQLSVADFHFLWGMCMLLLCEENQKDPRHSRLSQMHTTASFKERRLDKLYGAAESSMKVLGGLRFLCASGFYTEEMLSVSLCLELIEVMIHISLDNRMLHSTGFMPVIEQIARFSPVEYFEEEELALTIAELCMHYAHSYRNIILQEASNFSEVDRLLLTLQSTASLAEKLNSKRYSQIILAVLCTAMELLKSTLSKEIDGPRIGNFFTSLAAGLVKRSAEEGSKDDFPPLLLGLVESLLQVCEQCLLVYNKKGWENEDGKKYLTNMSTILGLAFEIARITPDGPVVDSLSKTSRFIALERCGECLHDILLARQVEIQVVGLQNLKSLLQAGLTEFTSTKGCVWIFPIIQNLGAKVLLITFDLVKAPLTLITAAAVGEGLKILLLILSLMEKIEAQEETLYVLLVAVIACLSIEADDSQVGGSGLRSVAMKLVTHLASSPEFSAIFRKVLLDMPTDLRQRLQESIRASMAQQVATQTFQNPPVLVVATQKTSVSQISLNAKALDSSSPSIPKLPEQPTQIDNEAEAGSDDEDWDDFQSHPVSDLPNDKTSLKGSDDDEFESFQASFPDIETSGFSEEEEATVATKPAVNTATLEEEETEQELFRGNSTVSDAPFSEDKICESGASETETESQVVESVDDNKTLISHDSKPVEDNSNLEEGSENAVDRIIPEETSSSDKGSAKVEEDKRDSSLPINGKLSDADDTEKGESDSKVCSIGSIVENNSEEDQLPEHQIGAPETAA